MKKYCALRSEIALHQGFYKAHVRNFQLLVGALLSGLTFALAHNLPLIPSKDTWLAWCVALLALSLTANYLILDIMDPQYAILVISDRLGMLEEELNQMMRRRILIWENGGAAKAFGDIFPFPFVLSPNPLFVVTSIVLFVCIALGVPGYGYFVIYNNCVPACSCLVLSLVVGSIFISVALTAASLYSIISVSRCLRGKPRTYFATLLAKPLVDSSLATVANQSGQATPDGGR